MALPFGKLTFLFGAGIVTSVLAKEGQLSTVSDVVGGAWKIVSKMIKQDDPGPLDRKPRDDNLLAQVNSIQQELLLLSSSRPVTIVTASGTGARKCGMIVVIVVVGYGYIWWKGWKLSDMMFATKHSLSDACNSVARQLEDVYSSISAAQQQLSSKITNVDRDVNKIVEISQATKEEVHLLRGKSKIIGEEFESVRDVVQTLESKLSVIEGKQDITTLGVMKLCDYVPRENGGTAERIQASRYGLLRSSLELPGMTPSSRTGALPPALPLEPPSPSNSSRSLKVDRSPGLKEFNGVLQMGESSRSPKVSNGIGASEYLSNWSSSNGLIFSGSVLTRQRSATNAVALQAHSSGQ